MRYLVIFTLHQVILGQDSTHFQKIWEPSQNSRLQKGDMQQGTVHAEEPQILGGTAQNFYRRIYIAARYLLIKLFW